MDIYPLAEQNSPKNFDDSTGFLNTFGIHCLIDEIQKHESLFSSSSNEEKYLAWNEIQKNLENIGVKRASVANIKRTWHYLLTKYYEWKENPQSKVSFHIFFEKMKFVEEKHDTKYLKEFLDASPSAHIEKIEDAAELKNDLNEFQDAELPVEIAHVDKVEDPAELILSQSLPFTFALIDAVKKATYLRSGPINDEYEVSLAMKHPTLGVIQQNMAQAGFHYIEDEDIIHAWTSLLRIHVNGNTEAIKSALEQKICEKLSFVDQKPARLARKIYQRYNPETRQFGFVTPMAKKEERRRVAAAKAVDPDVPAKQNLFWFYFFAIVFIVLAVIYAFYLVETTGMDFPLLNMTYYKGASA